MSVDEREWFLSGVHLGVLSITSGAGRGPLTVPVWYAYEPGEDIRFVTAAGSRKAALIRSEGRLSMCAHNDEPPYRYVSVEGPVVGIEESVSRAVRSELARRYLGPELGERYAAGHTGEGLLLVRLHPEHWWSADFGKRPP